MGKGIYRVVNSFNNKELMIFASEDLQKDMANFQEGIMPNKYLEKYRFKDSLKAEILEETEELAERYAFYTWPKISRIKYSKECMSKSRESGFPKRVKNVVNWLVGAFPDAKFSFEIFMLDDHIAADVFENGNSYERYTFKNRCKEPSSREFIG